MASLRLGVPEDVRPSQDRACCSDTRVGARPERGGEGRSWLVRAGRGGEPASLLPPCGAAWMPPPPAGTAEPSRETSGRRCVLFLADIRPCPDCIWGRRMLAAAQGRDPGASSQAGEGGSQSGPTSRNRLANWESPGCRRVPRAVRSSSGDLRSRPLLCKWPQA